MDLLTPTQYPYIFSPDFSKYLDIDRKEKVFLIRDTFTQKKLATVPLYVMNCKNEPHVAVAARFKWEDNHTIKYVNLEGIERRIDVSHNEFNEVQSDYHYITPCTTLFWFIFFIKALGWEQFAQANPDMKTTSSELAPMNYVLKFFLSAFLFLCIMAVQYLLEAVNSQFNSLKF